MSNTYSQSGKVKRQKVLTGKQWAFCQAMVELRDQTKAAIQAGYADPTASGSRLMNPTYHPQVVEMVQKLIKEVEERAMMSASDVLRYMQTVMLLNPFKYFTPGPDGSFLISAEELKKLPDSIACFIEESTLRIVETDDKTTTLFSVKLVSKTKMAELVGRHMLGEAKPEGDKPPFDWEGLHRKFHSPPAKDDEKDDPIENEIKAVAALPPHKPAKPSTNGHQPKDK